MIDPLRLSGRLHAFVTDVETGRVLEERRQGNLVTAVGRDVVRDALISEDGPVLSHYAVGTGTTPAIVSDAALETEVARGVITQVTPKPQEIQITFYLPSTDANDLSITEAGVFTAGVGGQMFARAVFDGITKTSSVAITFVHTISIGAS